MTAIRNRRHSEPLRMNLHQRPGALRALGEGRMSDARAPLGEIPTWRWPSYVLELLVGRLKASMMCSSCRRLSLLEGKKVRKT